MSCERIREQIPECLAGKLDPAAREELIAHLETCSGCRSELAEMGAVWRGMEAIPVVEPSGAMKSRFLEVLEAYQAGMDQGRERAITAKAPWYARLWPARAAWQAAMALALIASGALGSRYLAKPSGVTPEIASLQNQVETLRQTVALAMMQDSSTSSRIRGVSYGAQVGRPDEQIDQALLHTLNHDSNVNVRLSAVDALEKLSTDPAIRRALVDSLPMQDSPLVQIAVMDVLVAARDRNALTAIRKIADDPQTDSSVRDRAAAGIKKLEVSQ